MACDLSAAAGQPAEPAGRADAQRPVAPGQGLTPLPADLPPAAPGEGSELWALNQSVRFEAEAVTTGDVAAVLGLLAQSCRPRQRAGIAAAVRTRHHLRPGAQPDSDLVRIGGDGPRRAVHYEIGTEAGTWTSDEHWTQESGTWRRVCGRGPSRDPGGTGTRP